jgi:signal peptidase I
MLRKMLSIEPRLWILLGLVLLLPIISVSTYRGDGISPSVFLYVVEPIIATAIAILSFVLIGGERIRVKHQTEKAFLIAAIICVWFVVYFLSGLILTYVRNSLVVGIGPTVLNVAVYSITAVALEYTRYQIMASVSRRNILWFGSVVSVVFALTQISYGQVDAVSSPEELIKVVVANIVPAFAASFLLTYLALTSGFGSMLVFRLGMVFIAVVPPIIPNYDWYLIGISSLILSLSTYLIVDRQLQHQNTHKHKQIQHIKKANDIMFILILIGLVAFMTGVFSYRPLAIISNSMQPVYSRGAMVIIERVSDPIDIEVGDIVQYQSEGKTITHRVVAIDAASDGSGKRVYTTKGDNSPSNDPIVAGNQIGGVVKAQIPYIGYPTIWLREMAR